jgi:hypothetical protein
MISKKLFTGIVLLFAFVFSLSVSARDYYQIKVYTIKNQAQETSIDSYLKDAYLPALHKAGIKKVGVFKPAADDPAAGTKVFVFIPLKQLNQIEKIESQLAADKEYQAAGSDYINAKYDNPAYERIESVLLKAFDKMPEFYCPKFDTPKSEQIFELRSYHSATEKIYRKKVEMFNEGGETEIFSKIGANAIFYGEVISGASMPNLMYMTSYASKKSNEEHWKAFTQHPDWLELKEKEEYKNTVSHIDKWLCHPTDYSDI